MAFPADKSPEKTYRYLVSACLAGYNCTYKGSNKLKRRIKRLVEDGLALAVCPEIIGGLGIPRENSEIAGGSGLDVFKKKAKVLSASGKDLSSEYIAGANFILRIAKKLGIKRAILKSKSPACGAGLIYDGTFAKKIKKGDGVLTALLRRNGIKVYAPNETLESLAMKVVK